MVKDHYQNLNCIKAAVRDYELATGVKCYLLDQTGKRAGDKSCYQCNNICEFIKKFDHKGVCTHDYLGSCKPALEKGEAHYYDCPYGLSNIAVPIITETEIVYYASSGPILTQSSGKLVINRFLEQNELLSSHYDDIKYLLQGVPLVDDERLQALSNTLQRAVIPIISNNLNSFREKNYILSSLIKELRKEVQRLLYPEYEREAYVMQKEIELLSAKQNNSITELNKKALEMIMSTFINSIFKYRVFEESKHRGAQVFLALLEIAKNKDINQELVFGEKYIAIRQLLEAKDYLNLNQTIYATADRFQRAFFIGSSINNNESILHAMEYIRQNYMNITLQDVAKAVSLNPSYLSNLFKKSTGQSYSEYLNKVRIEASKQFLREGLPLAQIANNVGFADQSHFIKVFKRYEGVSPSKWLSVA
ncbi:helix-turn-helix domain-containing protein [Dehalobacterium formicoaceticum]|uniref:helix-turn-helix domain-containing protein n=1 Tax=Dehalobacterium formicoaceticum TaxID=51515 RepID=UPI0031F6DE75